jgi:hypothetical protein
MPPRYDGPSFVSLCRPSPLLGDRRCHQGHRFFGDDDVTPCLLSSARSLASSYVVSLICNGLLLKGLEGCEETQTAGRETNSARESVVRHPRQRSS